MTFEIQILWMDNGFIHDYFIWKQLFESIYWMQSLNMQFIYI